MININALKNLLQSLVFVDCEAWGSCPRLGQLTEFGAVLFKNDKTFHGIIKKSTPNPENPAIPLQTEKATLWEMSHAFDAFYKFLRTEVGPSPKMITDNPYFDGQWIIDGFLYTQGTNPFGHSARRIGDFYAGLTGDFSNSNAWKKFRKTKHDHHPVHDAQGNKEAFIEILKRYCPKALE